MKQKIKAALIIAIGIIVASLIGSHFSARTTFGDSNPTTFDSATMTSTVVTLGTNAPVPMFRLGNLYTGLPSSTATAISNANRHFGQIQNVGAVPAYCVANATSSFTSNTFNSSATTATGTITIAATSTATGTVAIAVNGFTLTTASLGSGTTASTTANAIAVLVNASSSVLSLTATTSTNTVVLTATASGPAGNVTFSYVTSQNGQTITSTSTNSVITYTQTPGSNGLSSTTYGFVIMPSSTVNSVWNAQSTGANMYTGQVFCVSGGTTTNVVVEEAN